MSSYAFLKPSALGLDGFAYGVITIPLTGDVPVSLVTSERWDAEPARSATRPATEVLARQVTAEEALSGIGTFVGAYVCVSRDTATGGAEWDYGLITGYRSDQPLGRGTVKVVFSVGHEEVPYDQAAWQELNIATYILQPCAGRAVLDLMPGEMRAANLAVFNHFHGHGRAAARSVKPTATRLGLHLAREDRTVRLYDYVSLRVRQVNAKTALDHVFYVVGDRRAPRHVRTSATLFDVATDDSSTRQAPASPVGAGTAHPDGGGLSDSEASSDDSNPDMGPQKKRPRVSAIVDPTPAAAMSTADRLRADLNVMVRTGAWSNDPSSSRDGKVQFRPSGVHDRVHAALINVKFTAMDPQLLMESLQSFVDLLGFLPHPAVLRSVYGWDFGLRDRSILHFRRLSSVARQAAARAYDMTDFSRKNKLPAPSDPTFLDTIIECIDCLTGAVDILFLPVVHELLVTLRQFILKLRLSAAFSDASTLPKLCQWIDGRLEAFRAAVAQGDMAAASQVCNEFSAYHASFQELMNTLTERCLAAFTRVPPPTHLPAPRQSGPPSGGPAQRPRRPDAPIAVPAAVLAALPVENKKALCMRYLSRNHCRGRNGGCSFDSRGHFRPSSLPPVVRDFINAHLGGLKPEFASL